MTSVNNVYTNYYEHQTAVLSRRSRYEDVSGTRLNLRCARCPGVGHFITFL